MRHPVHSRIFSQTSIAFTTTGEISASFFSRAPISTDARVQNAQIFSSVVGLTRMPGLTIRDPVSCRVGGSEACICKWWPPSLRGAPRWPGADCRITPQSIKLTFITR